MRKYGLLLSGAALLTLGLGITMGQQRGGFGGGGFGEPGGGGTGALGLLMRPDVLKELGLEAEDVQAKLPDAIQKALKDVLNETQLKRLRQIELQQRGSRALNDATVQKELKVTDEQKENIDIVLKDAAKEARELFGKDAGGDFKERFAKIQAMQKETTEKVLGVLTSAQRKAYKQMLGEEFKMEQGGFGFGGFGAKGTRKKPADNK